MRSTRRLLDLWLVALASCGVATIASCASDRDSSFDGPEADASSESSTPGPGEAGTPDAAPFDGGLRAVECESPSCAVALTTGQGESFCALLRDGTVVCWGANANGQLGRGETSTGNMKAERVTGLQDIVTIDRTCAVDKDGAAFCWGRGPFTAAGTTNEPSPVKLDLPPVTKVSAHSETACALADGNVLCWGSNANGQIAIDGGGVLPPTRVAIRAGSPIRNIAVNEATFVVREDGTSESWGANEFVARGSSLSPDPYPRPTSLGRLDTIDVVEKRACAATGGDAFCWGDDIGPEPRQTPVVEPVVQIATTKSFPSHDPRLAKLGRWCAVGASGGVYCSGDNTNGQTGDGTTNHAARPVRMLGLPAKAARVRTTFEATCVLLTTGKIYCVGNNYYGQLGGGKMRTSSLVPVEVNLP
ncbi:MAG: hypothetical protein K0S65_1198 [Labilithrix sp.]|nr:hypothetical protein [Labilithrix sp.]